MGSGILAAMSDEDRSTPRPPRRPRYRGTHPRSFDEKYKERDPGRFPEMQEHVRAQGRTPAGTHVPVLMSAVMEALAPQPGQTIVDCTLGYGGHALEIARRLGPSGLLIGLDVDREQLARTTERLSAIAEKEPIARLSLHHANFAGLPKVLASLGVEQVDGLLADLGVSSMQIDAPARGFSYKFNGPLDMRMDPAGPRTAADALARMTEPMIVSLLKSFGDEPHAERIAAAIVAAREQERIDRTGQLVRIIEKAVGGGRGNRGGSAGPRDEDGPHPAARTFQALRMLVNDELPRLHELLRVGPLALKPGGRMAIISFHSGEDRIVKHTLRTGVDSGLLAVCSEEPIRAEPGELRDNPRSAPARLRWAVRGEA